MKKLLLICVVVLAAAGCMGAQRGGARFGGGRFGAGANFRAGFGAELGSRYGAFGAIPLLDPLYADALYSAGYPVAAQLPVVIVQGGATARTEMAVSPTQPLLIELEGGRYVRVSGEENSGAEMVDAAGASRNVTRDAERPAAVLVFRDGHREEISGYTIADGVVYASGDYYSGTSDRKIPLTALNVSDTVSANRARGVEFRLPAARNEVMVGP